MSATITAQEAGASVPAPPRENLIRATTDIGLTRSEGAEMPTLTGHFAVWDQWTEIRSAYEGNFMERFAPGSMNKTLSERAPKVLFQHGKDPHIGDKVLGAATRVEPDSTGAFYEVPLLDTSYNRDLIPGLEAGLYGASFRFSVLQEDVNKKPPKSDFNPRGIQERTVTEARVMEFGPVTFPAYTGATAGVRSLTDEFLLDRFLADDEIVDRFAAKVEERLDAEDLGTLACMLQSGAQYIADQDESDDQANIPKMEAILASLAELVPVEVQENEPAEPDDEGSMMSESEPPGATTRAAMPAGMTAMPAGVKSCSMSGSPGYTAGGVCHVHDGSEASMKSAMQKATADAKRSTEPEPSEATTPDRARKEPELPVATTRSRTDLFWFVPPPSSKGAK